METILMFQHALLNEMLAFIAVAEQGSFTRAAETLSTTKSSVGKAIQKLEDDLGIKLFNRSTRSVRLTEEGQIYFEAAKHAVTTIKDAKQQLDARKAEPSGHLRINAPVGIGRTILQALQTFLQANEKVTTELVLSDQLADVIDGNWDVVVRIGELADTDLIARKLCTLKLALVAAPSYLEKHGTPQSLEELNGHTAIVCRAPNGRVRPWCFQTSENNVTELRPDTTAIFSDGRSLVDATLSGLGIAQIYDKAYGNAVEQGELIQLMPGYTMSGPPVHAIIPSGRVMPAKTRVFIEFLQELFGTVTIKS